MSFNSELLHPVRFRRALPFSSALARLAPSWVNHTFPHPADLNPAQIQVQNEYNAAVDKVPFEDRPDPDAHFRALSDGLILGFTWAWHAAAGRNSFVLAAELATHLAATDLGDVQFQDIEPPFNNFYVNFGGVELGSLPGPSNLIDGAYLRASGPQEWVVTFTSRAQIWEPHWPFTIEPFLEVVLQWKTPGETLADVFARGIEDLRRVAAGKVIGRQGRVQVHQGQLAQDPEFVAAAAPACGAALTLLGNALCYFSSTPEVSEPELPEDLPEDLRQALDSGSKSAKQKARAQLLDRGFQLIRWLGPRGARPVGNAERNADSGREVRTHWRRGHWRRQAYGPGRGSRRLVWIRPMLISGVDREGPDRAYLVE